MGPQDGMKLFYVFCIVSGCSILYRCTRKVIKGYHAFLSLGPGGTPSTFAGYLWVSYLSCFVNADPLRPPSLANERKPREGYLQQVSQRTAARPQTAGIAPHRQMNQIPSPKIRNFLRDGLHKLVDEHPSVLRKGTSCFEKHGLALFVIPKASSSMTRSHLNPTCEDTGEICHLHGSDSSLHLTLHPLDAAIVISSGWGERHPIAGCRIPGSLPVADNFIMIYTPQTPDEVGTVVEFVKAAAWWVDGVKLKD